MQNYLNRVEIPVRMNPNMLDKSWWKENSNILKLEEYRY